MDKLHINVSAEGIRALDHLSVALNDRNQQMRLTLRQLREVFEDNAPGLGAHTAEIELLLDELEDLAATAAQNNQRLAKKAARAATIRRGIVEESPYRKTDHYPDNQYLPTALGQLYDDLAQQGIRPTELGPGKEVSGYRSPYVKTTYSETVSYTDPKTKQRVTKLSTRDVYENSRIDPSQVVPAGTRYANNVLIEKDTSNLELMKKGNAPFVWASASDGRQTLVQVELHHLSSEETHHGSTYFTEKESDGSLVEIASTTHDAYSKQLHIPGPSFRHDGEGNKTADGAKYNNFRSAYWKHRAQKFNGAK